MGILENIYRANDKSTEMQKLVEFYKGHDSIQNSLERVDVSKRERFVCNSSSKGNQMKWKSDGRYIKLDMLGYEGLAECVVSKLLTFTDVKNVILYRYCDIYEEGVYRGRGAYSYDFLAQDEFLITFGRILEMNGYPYSIHYEELRDLILDEYKIDIKSYVDSILCLDSIDANDDRHFNNFALVGNANGEWKTAPLFDNGAACLSDLMTYPLHNSLEDNLKLVDVKPFAFRYEDQLYFNARIGINLTSFKASLNPCDEYERRAYDVILHQLDLMKFKAWEEL